MPMSIKCIIGKWLHKGKITQEEYDAVIKKLEGHDKQIMADAILFREATKEERESVDNYIKSISKKLHTFTDEQLAEHDKQIRNKAIDDFFLKVVKAYYDDNLNECELCNIERQLKEHTE